MTTTAFSAAAICRAATWGRAVALDTFVAARHAARRGGAAAVEGEIAAAAASALVDACALARRCATDDNCSAIFSLVGECEAATAAAKSAPGNAEEVAAWHAAVQAAPKGDYQWRVLNGRALWSGADLCGAARNWGGKYRDSRRALLARLRAAGVPVWVEVGANNAQTLVVAGVRA